MGFLRVFDPKPTVRQFNATLISPHLDPRALQIICRQSRVAQNFSKQTGADDFSGVNRDGCHSPVWMPKPMMASLRPDDRESMFFQDPDYLLPC